MAFVKATKAKARLRMAIDGPSGSGKSFTSLLIAKYLSQGGKIAAIDSERGSMSKYANLVDFDVCELTTFSPDAYVNAIHDAENAGYAVLIIDSLSHAWMGKEGALEQVDRAAARNRAGNSFAAWREVTPMHNALVDAILQSPMHIITTMRVKMEYVLEENEKGKKVPRKIGLAPVQRDGMEYEFDIVADMDMDHKLIIGKTRCSALSRAVVQNPGEDFAKTIMAWLSDGVDVPPAALPTPTLPSAPQAAPDPLKDAKREFGAFVMAWTKMPIKHPDYRAACMSILKKASGTDVALETAGVDELKTGSAWIQLKKDHDWIACVEGRA